MSDGIEGRVGSETEVEVDENQVYTVDENQVYTVDENQVYTTGQVAEICRISTSTVKRCFENGELKGFHVPSSRERRVPRKYLTRFMIKYSIPIRFLDEDPSEREKVYTTKQAEKIFGRGISSQTIGRCFDTGDFKEGYHVPGSKFRRIPHSSLIQFAKDNDLVGQVKDYFGKPIEEL